MHPAILSTLFGIVWGGAAWALLLGAPDQSGAPAGFFGPVIGLLVYFCSIWVYRIKSYLLLVVWTPVTVCFSAGVYGAVMGALIHFAKFPPQRDLLSDVIGPAGMCAMGVIAVPPYWFLMLFAFGCHVAVMHLDNERRTKPAALVAAET